MKQQASATALALAFPGVARAAEAAGGANFSFATVFVQMLASLALVLGLIYLAYYAANRWFRPGVHGKGTERHIRLVETRYLAPKKSLVLVEVGGEFLLLGSSGDNLSFIKQIDILEEIEVLDETAGRTPLATLFQGKLDAVTTRLAAMKQGRADAPERRAGEGKA
ncbi:flagellar biosynthetic protein FliO [Geobacter anodireducens]|uniref:Flagellar protein n=3 Tax=Geobacter TaxID=28231 RepID=A0ABR9NQB1_9BACT|nr:flagellar biosynthetic protein FliO [Geobacter anodireducens]ANA39346.1 flagellar biosynthesis protein FliO [Geobacter anodireducens]MBE2886446.1 flagellar biosynthetic protein FliO [Geobacter anodireducens]HMN02471.1 flagellar biosynthetic protein FliO [Geobacter anodireducens]